MTTPPTVPDRIRNAVRGRVRLLLAGGLALGLGLGGTYAIWTDEDAAATGNFKAGTLGVPGSFRCVDNGTYATPTRSVTLYWDGGTGGNQYRIQHVVQGVQQGTRTYTSSPQVVSLTSFDIYPALPTTVHLSIRAELVGTNWTSDYSTVVDITGSGLGGVRCGDYGIIGDSPSLEQAPTAPSAPAPEPAAPTETPSVVPPKGEVTDGGEGDGSGEEQNPTEPDQPAQPQEPPADSAADADRR